MANPTTNFGWQMPTSTDLVTDLPADFETFGQAVDTTLVDLKGGTTGQILSKASGTDMDFTWVAPTTGDITGVTAGTGLTGGGTSGDVTLAVNGGNPVPLSTVTTNGDLIYGTGSGAVTRLGIGSTSQVLTVSGGVPTWATASSGSMTQLATGTLSGTQVQLSSISGSYKNLHLVLRDLTFSSSAAKPQLKFNNTSTEAAVTLFRSGTTTPYQTNSGIFYLGATSTQSMTNTSAENNFAITIFDYAQTAAYKSVSYCGVYRNENEGTYNGVMGGGGVRLTAAITSLEITMDGTITFSGGTYILYGVN